MKITVQEPTRTAPSFNAQDMKVGQLGQIIDISAKHIVLRVYNALISLTDPQATWDGHALRFREVRLLEPSSTVTLTQEGVTVAPPPARLSSDPSRESRARIDAVLFSNDRAEIRKLIRSNDIIPAIKFVRTKTNVDLKEAKDYVDQVRSSISE